MSRQTPLYIHQNPREQEGSRSSLSLTGDPTDIRESIKCAVCQVEDIKQCLYLAVTEKPCCLWKGSVCSSLMEAVDGF